MMVTAIKQRIEDASVPEPSGKLAKRIADKLTAYGDQRVREARAAAIKEIAKFAHDCGETGGDLYDAIVTLADTPPQSEGGEG